MDVQSDPSDRGVLDVSRVLSSNRGQNGTALLTTTESTMPQINSGNSIVAGRGSTTAVFGGGRRQWWNFCFVYGDQTKYYRQLYGKRTPIRRLQYLKQQQNQLQTKQDNKCLQCGERFGNLEQLQ